MFADELTIESLEVITERLEEFETYLRARSVVLLETRNVALKTYQRLRKRVGCKVSEVNTTFRGVQSLACLESEKGHRSCPHRIYWNNVL